MPVLLQIIRIKVSCRVIIIEHSVKRVTLNSTRGRTESKIGINVTRLMKGEKIGKRWATGRGKKRGKNWARKK